MLAAAFTSYFVSHPRKPGLAGQIESLPASGTELLYRGRSLGEWLADMQDGNVSEGTREAVKFYGSNAIPQLVAMIGVRDSTLKQTVMEWNHRHDRVHLNLTRAGEYQWRAALAIQFIAKDSGPAIPALTKLLSDDDSGVRAAAADALGMLETHAEPAVPELVQCLKDPYWMVRYRAVVTLGRIGRRPSVVVPALIAATRDSDARVRAEAAGYLAAFGDDALAAVPALLDALNDSDPKVRQRAGSALKYIAPGATSGAGVK